LVARACEEGKEGEFYRRAEAVSSHRRGLQETPAWVRSSGNVQRGRRPMGRGGAPAVECASAACHRPSPPRKHHSHLVHSVTSAGLEPLGLPAPQRARAGWVRHGRHGGARATSCAGMPAFQTFAFSLLQTKFSPKFQTEVTRTLNTKVVEQATLYNICKG
jgi:hypothetical protein